ncbi:cupin domain-containing protein [Hymenobacter humi]|uniref:Cupin domain-containing protein n=1 Tax=Hymenobacter humi TaxID=1411620 RepID=A0ABW2UCL8_9BACT
MHAFIPVAAGLALACLASCTTDSTADNQAAGQAKTKESSRPVTAATSATPGNQLKGFHINIEQATRSNPSFRQVLYTGPHLQAVLMSLKPGEEIGSEVHETHDQFFRIEGGTGKCVINSRSFAVSAGDAVVAPAGSTHNVINTSTDKPLRLYTLYAPPQHRDGITRATKQEATQNEAPFDGKTTE